MQKKANDGKCRLLNECGGVVESNIVMESKRVRRYVWKCFRFFFLAAGVLSSLRVYESTSQGLWCWYSP